MKLHTESPYRKDAECPVYNQCGGCQLQHLTYEGQLQAKEKQVRDVMQRIGGLGDVPVHPVLGMKTRGYTVIKHKYQSENVKADL